MRGRHGMGSAGVATGILANAAHKSGTPDALRTAPLKI